MKTKPENNTKYTLPTNQHLINNARAHPFSDKDPELFSPIPKQKQETPAFWPRYQPHFPFFHVHCGVLCISSSFFRQTAGGQITSRNFPSLAARGTSLSLQENKKSRSIRKYKQNVAKQLMRQTGRGLPCRPPWQRFRSIRR